MPNWKKLIVSGSDASLNSLNVTTNVTAQSFTGSFSGSFTAPGATTQVVYNSGGVLAANSGFVYSGSNVGIGTTSPTYKLHVSSSNNNDGIAIHYPANNSTLFPFIISSNADSAGDYVRINTGIIELKRNGGASTIRTVGSINNLTLESATNLIFNTNGASERMRIDTSGNVGIGTTTPSSLLNVVAAGSAPAALTVQDGARKVKIGRDQIEVTDLSDVASTMYLQPNSNLVINGTAGNVGIGTQPSQKLEVQGQAQIGNDNVASAGLFFARKNTNQAKSHYFLSAQESPTYQWIEGGYFTSELAGVSVANNSGKPYYESYAPAGQNKSFGFINQTTSGSSFTSTAATASMTLYQGGNIALAYNGGNVGIGTTNPSYKLDVAGDVQIQSTYFLRFANEWGIQQTGTNLNFAEVGSADGRLYLKAGGNVGIGTTSPSEKLHVEGTTDVNILVRTSGVSGNAYTTYENSGDNTFAWAIGRHNAGGFYFNSSTGGTYPSGTTTTRMVIDTSGNVGIGTTTPAAKLDVYGGDIYINYGQYLGGGTAYNSVWNRILMYNGGTGDMEITMHSTNWYLRHNANATFAGNVGIGTTSPTQKLDVAGAISVSGSVIDYEVAPALIAPGPAVNIISFTPGTHYAAFVDYVIKDASTGANQRVGTIQISISLAGAAAVMNEVTTVDIGNTSAITFAVSYGAPTWLTATNSGLTPYDINYMVRYF